LDTKALQIITSANSFQTGRRSSSFPKSSTFTCLAKADAGLL
jgi:hypothetical protein